METTSKTEPCIAKVGEPFHMSECNKPCEHLTAEQAEAEGLRYSGWRHVDRSLTGHGAVPRSFL